MQAGFHRIGTAIIRAMTRRIVRRFRPSKVVLFGSYAWGRPTRDSDVDLLVVLSTRRDPADVAADIACVVDPPFPLDVLVKTPKEIRRRMREGDCFLAEVMAKGWVLHETRHTRVG